MSFDRWGLYNLSPYYREQITFTTGLRGKYQMLSALVTNDMSGDAKSMQGEYQ